MQTMTCPQCGHEFELEEALRVRVEADVRGELDALHATALVKARADAAARARVEAAGEAAERIEGLTREAAAREEALKAARDRELALLGQQRDLRDREEELEITIARRLEDEREDLISRTRQLVEDGQRLRDAEKDQRLAALQHEIAELKRKSEQGSQQLQGDVLEQDLEARLRAAFLQDVFEPVPTGVRGADVIQHVIDHGGRDCGVIVWEGKNTKAWSDGWVPKLKGDTLRVNGDVSALVSKVMPAHVRHFDRVDGVWVGTPEVAVSLGAALRQSLIDLAAARRVGTGLSEAMARVHAYLSGSEFRQRVESILETTDAMHTTLEAERRAYQRLWAQRQQQIDVVGTQVAAIGGSLAGLGIGSLGGVPALSLPECQKV